MPAIHQLLPSFVFGDATGQAALHLQLLLRRLGIYGEIFASEVEGALCTLARPANTLRVQPGDLVLYHHGLASSLSARLLHLPCRKGVVFHNISPSHAYVGTPLHAALVQGRAQLAAMAPFVDVAIGVSHYNAAELREAGYENVHVVPLFIEPERFAQEAASETYRRKIAGGEPCLLAVSRIAPHKRFEDVLSLHEELLRIRPDAKLLCVGGYEAGSRYFRSLRRQASAMRNVQFLGRVSHAQLVAAYRSAHVFVSMSEHEGFGVPLLEAMAAEVPILAFAAAAVPETLGGAGIAFTEKRFAALAELASELASPSDLRARVLQGQKRRLLSFGADAVMPALEGALASVPPLDPPTSTSTALVLPPSRPTLASGRRAASGRSKGTPRRVGVIVQRWGEAIGGAERHARLVAERLASAGNDVTVLTTTAEDHLTWANTFPEGESLDGALKVKRFRVERPREMRAFNRLSRAVFGVAQDRLHEEHWLAEQGPLVPGLLQSLSDSREAFDAFLFFTYLYTPTAWGLPLVAKRALVVPTAHDEPPLAFGLFADVFERPAALLCNTPEELALIQRRFPKAARARIVGVGVDEAEGDASGFRARHGLRADEPYLLYVGRIEEGKGVGQLVRDYDFMRSRLGEQAPALLLAGHGSVRSSGEGVRLLGRISEEDKLGALAGAAAVVCPSAFESLSLLTLEAFAQGTPVLVNAASEVLCGQVARSQAGAAYANAQELLAGYQSLVRQREPLGVRARRYAREHSWRRVMDIYEEEIESVARRHA